MDKLFGALILCVCTLLSGCYQSEEDELHSVPVTNNPSMLPRSSHTPQGQMW